MPVTWKEVPTLSSDDDYDGEESQSFAGDRQYQQTLMYGQYRTELSEYAKRAAKKEKKQKRMFTQKNTVGLRPKQSFLVQFFRYCQTSVKKCGIASLGKGGGDWIFLLLLGLLMACISFITDVAILSCTKARLWAYGELTQHRALEYLAWVTLPIVLVLFAATFVQIVAPQSVGSGIPEMKTILRGVVLKEYLTWKTLVAKIIGLTATLGSGLPLGKEGPFVHIASIVATLLSHLVSSFKGIYQNESRKTEMLAAACAVGVACSFAAPIGGVLFSIEVTSVYFAVRNYWRGFFAAVSGAVLFRLLAVFYKGEETLTAMFKTNFKVDFPFDPSEIFAYIIVGVLCGLLGALFVYVHKCYVTFMRRNRRMKTFLQKHRLLYPFLVTLIYSTLIFPPGFGQFVAGQLSTHHQVMDLFSNFTWVAEQHTPDEYEIVSNWRTPWTSVFANLAIYVVFTFFSAVIASTVPVPSGIFIPVFKMGAAIGRFIGEFMAYLHPTGIGSGAFSHQIIPGGYSIVGAAAFSGSVTHTISTSVIVFELTGQITHILPVMIAVLVSNAVANLLQPSIYDSIILIKKLPYLPDILSSASNAYDIFVESFMVKKVQYIYYGITYQKLKETLLDSRKIRSLPLVDSPKSMILLGSIPREELITILEKRLDRDRGGTEVATAWKLAARRSLDAAAQSTSAERIVSSSLSPRFLAGNVRKKSGSLEDLRKCALNKTPAMHFFPNSASSPKTQEIVISTSSTDENIIRSVDGRLNSNIGEDKSKATSAGQGFSEFERGSTSSRGTQSMSGQNSNTSELTSKTSNQSQETLGLNRLSSVDSKRNCIEDECTESKRQDETNSSLTTAIISNVQDEGNAVEDEGIEEQYKADTINNSPSSSTDSLENDNKPKLDDESSEHPDSDQENGIDGPNVKVKIPSEKKTRPSELLLERRGSRFAVTRVTTPSNNSDDNTNCNRTIPSDKTLHTSSDTFQINETDVTLDIPENSEIKKESSEAIQIVAKNDYRGSDSIMSRRRQRATLPRKSILKKTESFTIPQMQGSPAPTLQHSPHYATVHGDSTTNWRFSAAFDGLRRKMRTNDTPTGSIKSSTSLETQRIKQMLENSRLDQLKWEDQVYQEQVDFSQLVIDPSPFQLVERTSLLKVHSIFSLLGLNHAYVTVLGRLIGVVALKELRAAIEAINSGTPQPNDEVAGVATAVPATEGDLEESHSTVREEVIPSSSEEDNNSDVEVVRRQ